MTAKVSIVERDGKSYVTVSDVKTTCEPTHVEVDLMYQNTPPLVSKSIKKIINANWKPFQETIYSPFEKFALNQLEDIYVPVLEKIACQDVYHMQ